MTAHAHTHKFLCGRDPSLAEEEAIQQLMKKLEEEVREQYDSMAVDPEKLRRKERKDPR